MRLQAAMAERDKADRAWAKANRSADQGRLGRGRKALPSVDRGLPPRLSSSEGEP